MALQQYQFAADPTQPDWLDRLAAMSREPVATCRYLDDEAIRRIREAADEDFRRIERELRQRFPEFYGKTRDESLG